MVVSVDRMSRQQCRGQETYTSHVAQAAWFNWFELKCKCRLRRESVKAA